MEFPPGIFFLTNIFLPKIFVDLMFLDTKMFLARQAVLPIGLNWPDLVQIRTFFLEKEVRKRSELFNKSLIFLQKWYI